MFNERSITPRSALDDPRSPSIEWVRRADGGANPPGHAGGNVVQAGSSSSRARSLLFCFRSDGTMRQAVVVIHGIGEQRPMSTLREFVARVVPASEQNRSRVFSKPDRMSESFELRQLSVEKSRSRPATDFYEYFWAHHMEGTKLRHLWPWFRAILLRSPRKVPAQLQVVWFLSWTLAVGALVAIVVSRLAPADADASGPWPSLALLVTFAIVQGFAINWLGDAARYLSPLPSNIAVRHTIRSEGIELLRQIHKSDRYDRVVIVGHSLGSVIGLDILTFLWSEVNTLHGKPDCIPQPEIQRVDDFGHALSSFSPKGEIAQFQDAQRALWVEQRQIGIPWLVTDFVTLGSPLAHATLLLARDANDLRTRQEQREIPTCPPVEDKPARRSERGHYHYVEDFVLAGQPRSVRVLHHAALFATTRWSNVYVPVRFGLVGDHVGGRLRPTFGPGIRDVPVTAGPLRFLPLMAHTHYWRGQARTTCAERTTALSALCEVLDLNSSRWLPRELVPPGDRAAL